MVASWTTLTFSPLNFLSHTLLSVFFPKNVCVAPQWLNPVVVKRMRTNTHFFVLVQRGSPGKAVVVCQSNRLIGGGRLIHSGLR